MQLLNFVSEHTVLAFIILVSILGLIFGIAIIISAYPCRVFVKLIHNHPMKDMTKFYFYYQKATAYRMLYIVHTVFYYTIKVMGTVMTFVTVYCALDDNGYILFCSLLAALCDVLALVIPVDKYMSIYVQGARALEYELNAVHRDEVEAKEKLNSKYEEAEKMISKDFL